MPSLNYLILVPLVFEQIYNSFFEVFVGVIHHLFLLFAFFVYG